MIVSWPVCGHDWAEILAVGSLTGPPSQRSLQFMGMRKSTSLAVTLPIANARGFSGYPELQESVPGQCPGIYA